MESFVNAIRLCGILPCVSANDPRSIAAALQALSAEGFPAAEVPCDRPAQAQLLSDALTLAGNLSGIAVGALVANAQQADAARRAGAQWVTLPASEAAALPENMAAFLLTTNPPYPATPCAPNTEPMHPLPPLTGLIASITSPAPAASNASRPAGTATSTPTSNLTGTPAGNPSQTTAARVPSQPIARPICCDSAHAMMWLAQPTPLTLLVQANAQEPDDRRWLAIPAVLAVRVQLPVTEANATALAASLKQRWAANMGFTLAHVGLNGIDASDAQTIARAFSALLGLPHRPQPASHFAGSLVEVMSGGGRGAHGHIGFGTDDLPRAMYFASRAGFAFDPDSRKDDALGNPLLYYLKNEIAGFGIHLIQKERSTLP